MSDYFFMLDKFYGKQIGVDNANSLQKGIWYKYLEDEESNKILLIDIAGIKEKDLTIDFEEDNYSGYIIIKGKTTTSFGDFEINQKFRIPITYLSNESSYSIKDGILYITIIPQKKSKFQIKKAEEE